MFNKGSLSAQRLLTAVGDRQPEKLEELSRQLWLRVWSRVSNVPTLKFFLKNPILIGISSKFQNVISTCIYIRKNYKNGEFSPSYFCQNLADDPVL